MQFDPTRSEHPAFISYGLAPIPDPRDDIMTHYVENLVTSGPPAVAQAVTRVSESGRRVLCAYAKRMASRTVREGSRHFLVPAIVAVAVGGLDHNSHEAIITMAIIEDAGSRIGLSPGEYFGEAADIVGHPTSVNLMVWLTRTETNRSIEVMGYQAAADAAGFRYKWVGVRPSKA